MRKDSVGVRAFIVGAVSLVACWAFAPAPVSADVLCSVATEPCPAGNTYPSGTVIEAELSGGPMKISSGFFIECTESATELKTLAKSGAPLLGEMTTLSFGSCTSGVESCGVFAPSLKYEALFSATGAGDGSVVLEEGTGFQPFRIKFFCGAITCGFRKEAAQLTLTGGNPALIEALSVPLTRDTGPELQCGNQGKWIAQYEVISPSPLFVTS